jgi:hypothetical protein
VDDGAIVPKHGCEPASFEQMVQVVPSSDVDHAGFQALSDRNSDDYGVKGSGPYKAISLFTIPSAEVKNFYVVSRGAHAKGIFYFRESAVEDIQIEIVWEYWHKSLVNSINMCILEHNSNSKGFGIFVSSFLFLHLHVEWLTIQFTEQTPTVDWDWMPAHQRSVTFNVIVRIPLERDSQITALHSHLENFNQSVITSHRQWDNMRLHGSNGAILADVSIGVIFVSHIFLTPPRVVGNTFCPPAESHNSKCSS